MTLPNIGTNNPTRAGGSGNCVAMETTDDTQAKGLLCELDSKVGDIRTLIHQLAVLNLSEESRNEMAEIMDALYQASRK